jgi:D-erythronate 2-dehydrogenase
MPGLSATVQEQIESLKRVSGNDVAKLIQYKPNLDIQKIVRSWAKDLAATRAKCLGFIAEKTFDEIIKIYIEEDLNKV